MFLLKGVRVPHHKHTQNIKPSRMPVAGEYVIPMSMHIGAPATPVVRVGDYVKVGQLIAESAGFISAPIHASVSGKVKKIGTITSPMGKEVVAITIESDTLQEIDESVSPPHVTDKESFLKAVTASGIVGLGGAGFPSVVKLLADTEKMAYLIVNCAECEPYITSDTRTMLDRTADLIEGVNLLSRYLGIREVVFGVEKNKPECIKVLKEAFRDNASVRINPLPTLYPQGAEKVMIYHTTGRVVPEGKLPIDAGCVVLNCTTLATIASYIRTGMPLVEKCVTVDGDCVKTPQNVTVPIGTSLSAIFDFCGGLTREPKKVLCGGPMMGTAVPSLDVPIMKATNAILAFSEKMAKEPESTACMRCGKCVSACPMRLVPNAMAKARKLGKNEELKALKVNLCMECGCCSYICPAKRPLVQSHKLAKEILRNQEAEGGKKA